MTLLLGAEEVESLLGIEDCLDALETSFKELAEGRAVKHAAAPHRPVPRPARRSRLRQLRGNRGCGTITRDSRRQRLRLAWRRTCGSRHDHDRGKPKTVLHTAGPFRPDMDGLLGSADLEQIAFGLKLFVVQIKCVTPI